MRRQFQSHPVGNYNPMRAKKAVSGYGSSSYRAQCALHVSHAVRAPTRYACGRGASLLTTFAELQPLCRRVTESASLFWRNDLSNDHDLDTRNRDILPLLIGSHGDHPGLECSDQAAAVP